MKDFELEDNLCLAGGGVLHYDSHKLVNVFWGVLIYISENWPRSAKFCSSYHVHTYVLY